MRRLTVFNSITLDGYFTGTNGDLSWAHENADAEWNAFTAENASGGGGELLFGRITYEMMASFWPTPAAEQSQPEVAAGMNAMPKVVFSRTLKNASWSNTKLVKDDPVSAVRRMKSERGDDLLIFGSGTIVSQLTQARLIDEYQIVLVPIILGAGRTMFEGLKKPINLKRTKSRAFGNGNMVLSYEPAD